MHTYAILVDCSQDTFIKKRLIGDFKISGIATECTITTLNGEETFKIKGIEGREVPNFGYEDQLLNRFAEMLLKR